MVWQLVFLVLLGAGLAAVLVQNPAVMEQTITLALFGETISTPLRVAALILAAGWVLMWIGGMLDAASAHASARRYRSLLGEREMELARVKAEAYDRGRGEQGDLRGRLELMDRTLNYLRDRVDALLRVTELPEEVKPREEVRPLERVGPDERTEVRREVRG